MAIGLMMARLVIVVVVLAMASAAVAVPENAALSPQEKFRVARSKTSVKLTDRSFGVITGKDFWVIKFFAPWCGHCMRLEPEWVKLAKEIDPELGVNVGEVNCVEQKRLEKEFGIQGYPTILMYHDRKAWAYTGQRTASSLLSYFRDNGPESWLSNPLTLQIPEDSQILELRTPAEKEMLKKAKVVEQEIYGPDEVNLAKAALPVRLSLHTFTQTVKQGKWLVKVCSTFNSDCQSIIPNWLETIAKVKSVFGDEIRFGEIESSEDFLEQFDIKSVPSFILFRDGQMFHYKKELENVVSFLDKDWAAEIPVMIPSPKIDPNDWTTSKTALRLVLIVLGIVGVGYIVNALIAWSNKSKSL